MSEIVMDKQAVAEAKVEMALWSKLFGKELDKILPGEYKGDFFVVRGAWMITWREISTTLDKCSERYKQLEDMSSTLRSTGVLAGNLSRLNNRQLLRQLSAGNPPVSGPGSEIIDAEVVESPPESVPGSEIMPSHAVSNRFEPPPVFRSIDVFDAVNRYRWDRGMVDFEKSSLRQSQIYVPPGISFAASPDGTIPCLKCSWFPNIFRQQRSPSPCVGDPSICNCPRKDEAVLLSSKFVPQQMFGALLNLWSHTCRRPVASLVRDLCNKLKIEYDKPFANAPIEREGEGEGERDWDWYPVATTNIIRPPAPQNVHQPTQTIEFREGGNSILGSIDFVRQSEGRWMATPTTCYQNRHIAVTVTCHAPFTKPYPLWNADLIANEASAKVRVMGSLLEAHERHNSRYDNSKFYFSYESVYTSWLGGADTVADVNWHQLEGREVLYYWDGSDEDAQLGLQVIDRLEKIGCRSLSIIQEAPEINDFSSVSDGKDKHFSVAEFRERFGEQTTNDALCTEGVGGAEQKEETSETDTTEFLVPPLIVNPTIIHLYADSGTLKSVLALTFGYLIATGKSTIELMTCSKPGPVLFWDGELRERDLKAKKRSIACGLKLSREEEARMELIHRRVNVLTSEGREEIDFEIDCLRKKFSPDEGVRLLVLDNMTHMTGSVVGSNEAWDSFFDWLKGLNDSGTSVIYVGHTNKEGQSKGSSRQGISTLADWKIEDYDGSKGAGVKSVETKVPSEEIELLIEKPGDNPYLKKYERLLFSYFYQKTRNAVTAHWKSKGIEDLVKKIIANQKSQGRSDEEVGRFWNMDRKQAERLRKKFKMSRMGKVDTSKDNPSHPTTQTKSPSDTSKGN